MGRGEYRDAMAVAGHVGGAMSLVGGVMISAAQGVVQARQQQREDSWADYWARRAAMAESLQAAADSQVIDLQDRLRHAEREIASLRRRLV